MRQQPISGHTRVFGLVGHPVRHSLSPAMYNTLFDRFDIDAVYLAFDVRPDQAEKVADFIRVMGLDGVNLTVPFKETVLPYIDNTTAAASEAGAVNVVTHIDNTLTGYNTDGEGFVRSLAEEGGPDPTGLHAVVLGAGGAARAVASGLLDRGAQRITILNRSPDRAQQAAEAITRGFPGADIDTAALTAANFSRLAPSARLVVNCTSGPAAGLISTFTPADLPAGASWVDINYWMDDPPAEDKCRQAGIRFHDGLGMLAHQGALAFELFTGYPVTGGELRQFLAEQE